MSDLPEVPEPIEEIIEDTPPADHEVRPPWVDEVIAAVEAIPDAIASVLPSPVPVEAAAEVTPGAETGGEPPEHEADETPESKPWTHKLPFSK